MNDVDVSTPHFTDADVGVYHERAVAVHIHERHQHCVSTITVRVTSRDAGPPRVELVGVIDAALWPTVRTAADRCLAAYRGRWP